MTIRLLLIAPRADTEVDGGQAKAGRLLADVLSETGEVTLKHVVQPSRLASADRMALRKRRLAFWREFIGTLGTFRPQLVHFFSPCTFTGVLEKAVLASIAKRRGARTILNLRNDPRVLIDSLPRWKRAITNRAIRVFDAYFCQYRDLEDFYVETIGADRQAIHVIHNAISGSTAYPSSDELKSRFSAKRIVTVGTLEPRKGTDVLLRAIAKLSGPHGTSPAGDIIGGDFESHFVDYAETVRALHKELGLVDRVVFHGRQWGEAKDAILDRATVFALPSHAEGFPNVVMEAMQRGLPVIMTDVGAARDIAEVGGRAVTLVPANDPTAMAEAIKLLLDEIETYRAAVADIDKAIAAFSPARMAQAATHAYKLELTGATTRKGQAPGRSREKLTDGRGIGRDRRT